LDLPVCESVGVGAFEECTYIEEASLPMCSYLASSAFEYCLMLSSVYLPVCGYIGFNAFSSGRYLRSIVLPSCSFIGSNAFYGCKRLSAITLRYSRVCTLEASNAFDETSIFSGSGSIYVPYSLVTSYKSASEWSYFSSYIYPEP